MSPDSDAVQWIVVVATLVQTVATVVQARQSGAARPAMAVTVPFKLGLLASLLSVLWLAAFNYMYDRRVLSGFAYYATRDELEDATILQLFLVAGDLAIPALGCAAVAALLRGLIAGGPGMSEWLVHVVTLAATAVSLFFAVAQMYAFGTKIFWIGLVTGTVAGLTVDPGPAKSAGRE
ncbi:hypothetical protein GCM10027445_60670 [Amycolatopsis endophytica]|uniref:Ammonia channel protein AmtB n=1 Tax=Amycolatopsis endophytica TaxID=860233 RepID=A0A853B5M6_9PSEU|nr:hypothetical protein [Amycolatopsis endophytica]NYI90543.1 ammonia channel protein AmtB [Amycolatopsis endophytica]